MGSKMNNLEYAPENEGRNLFHSYHGSHSAHLSLVKTLDQFDKLDCPLWTWRKDD